MAYNHKEIVAQRPSRLTSGHRMCAGCGAPPIVRMVLRALHEEDHAVTITTNTIRIYLRVSDISSQSPKADLGDGRCIFQ